MTKIHVARTYDGVMHDMQRVAHHLYAVLRQMPTETNLAAVQMASVLLREVTQTAKRLAPGVPIMQVDAEGRVVRLLLG